MTRRTMPGLTMVTGLMKTGNLTVTSLPFLSSGKVSGNSGVILTGPSSWAWSGAMMPTRKSKKAQRRGSTKGEYAETGGGSIWAVRIESAWAEEGNKVD